MADILPEWTERPEKRGLDPLGMQYSGIVLYQSLLPGISNVTLRARYYSYYCWVSEAYGSRATSDPKDWQQWLRRAEALYALVAAHDGSEPGIGGIEWAQKRLTANEPEIDFAADASTTGDSRYLTQSMGVFGGAYFTQMVSLGLFGLNDHNIGVRTSDRGRAAAEAFRQSIGEEAVQLLDEKLATAVVTPAELEQLRTILPNALKAAADERQFLQDILFGRINPVDEPDQRRRDTLALLLATAGSLNRRPTPEDVRWQLFGAGMHGLDDEARATRTRWEAYQCQDLMQVAAATQLSWSLSIMGEVDGGVMLSALRDAIEERIIDTGRRGAQLSWREFQEQFDEENYPYREVWSRLTGRKGTPEERSWDAITLMAAISRRLSERAELMTEVERAFPIATQARSMATELKWLGDREEQGVARLFSEYIADRIVRRHSWVAMQKLRRQADYTFLFEVREARLFPLKTYQPVATTPRLGPAIQFLADLDLIDKAGLTSNGRTLLMANS